MIDYNKENEEIEKYKGTDYWKPEPNTYEVVGIGDIVEGKAYEEEGKEPKPQFELKIGVLVEDAEPETKIWSFGKGITPSSTYGQLVSIGSKNGTLNGIKLKVKVMKSAKGKNTYTIM